MSALSWIAGLALIASAFLWLKNPRRPKWLWGALTGVAALVLVASLGWMFWWVPLVAFAIAILGFVVGMFALVFGRVVLMLVTILGLLIGFCSVGYGNWGWFGGPVPGGINSIAFDPEVDFLPSEAKCESTTLFVDHSVRAVEVGNPEMRQFSTAVSISLKGNDDKAVMSEMMSEICANPTVLEMVVKDMLRWTSKEIPGADENKAWLNKISKAISSNPLGINSFVEKSPTGVLVVTKDAQKYAAWVNTVLLRSVAEGKQSLTSIRNWEISAANDPTKGLPSVQEASVQENKPAWVRSFIDKMGNCMLKFGFNAEDRRFEVFPCKVPKPEQPGQPSNPGTPGQPPAGCTENCGENPPPGCTENCSPPPNPCPPGNEDSNCSPKSGDRKDWEYPADKPPVTVTESGTDTPDPVKTEVPGPVVTDTPTNPSGSETGGQAPGATPAPANPTPPASNEGDGTSDGTVGKP